MNKKGNIFIISIFFIAGILAIFLFVILIFVSEVNSILYNVKLDMYSMNKAAIIAVNKGITSREGFSYDKKTYLEQFQKLLVKNYNLDKDLKNDTGIIKSVKIIEYDIYLPGKRDKYSNKKLSDTNIHSVIEVKVKPIILEDLLQDVFTFEIHEDVMLNKINI